MSGEFAGRLRHRVRLQRRGGAGGDGGGGLGSDWTDLAAVAAEIQPRGTRPVDRASAERAVADLRVRLRYRADVVPGMRLMWRGEALAIVAVSDPTGERVVLELACEARPL